MRKLRIIVLILCACIIMTVIKTEVVVAANDAKATTFHLEKVEGTATVTNSKGKSMSLTDRMQLYSGDTIRTDEKSYAYISLDSSKLIKLEELSQAVIKRSGKKLEIKLEEGALYFEVNEKLANDEAMTIGTSNVSLSIRGTAGVVRKRTIEDSIQDTIWLLDGQIELNGIGAASGRETITVWGGERIDYIENSGAWSRDLINIMEIPGFADVTMRENASLMKNIYLLSGLDTEWIIVNAENRLAEDQIYNKQKYGDIFIKRQEPIPAPKPTEQPIQAPSAKQDDSGGEVPQPKPLPTQAPVPTGEPGEGPTVAPTSKPGSKPTAKPTDVPESEPTATPTGVPESKPTATPTGVPESEPTATPTGVPESEPTATPTTEPEKVTYRVTFCDWNDDVIKIQFVEEGGTAEPPPDPSRSGYVFVGWTSYDNIIEDTYVYPIYEKTDAIETPTAVPEASPTVMPDVVTYTVQFMDYDGTIVHTEQVEEGKMPSEISMYRTDYIFIGWVPTVGAISQDTIFVAQYEAVEAVPTTEPTE